MDIHQAVNQLEVTSLHHLIHKKHAQPNKRNNVQITAINKYDQTANQKYCSRTTVYLLHNWLFFPKISENWWKSWTTWYTTIIDLSNMEYQSKRTFHNNNWWYFLYWNLNWGSMLIDMSRRHKHPVSAFWVEEKNLL